MPTTTARRHDPKGLTGAGRQAPPFPVTAPRVRVEGEQKQERAGEPGEQSGVEDRDTGIAPTLVRPVRRRAAAAPPQPNTASPPWRVVALGIYDAPLDWLWLLGVVATIAWIVAIVDMVRRRAQLTRGQLAAWLLIVIIVPVLGTILYFVFGREAAV